MHNPTVEPLNVVEQPLSQNTPDLDLVTEVERGEPKAEMNLIPGKIIFKVFIVVFTPNLD